MSPLTLLALLDTGLPGLQGDSLHYRCLIHCLQRTLSDCFGSFPLGSPVVCKVGEILF